MKKHIFLLIFFFSLSNFNSQTTIVDSILSGGIYRNYRIYIPVSYNSSISRPLIINLHGYTSNAQQQQLYSNFMPIADTANFLMVYPNGTTYSGQPFWNAGISNALVDDIGFISHLIDSLKAQYNIDLNSVYCTGMSNGGFMSHTLACELSNRIAAIASVTGSIFTTQYGALCHPTRPVPVMQIHGTADPTVPYAGNISQNMEPIDSVIQYWVTKNNCNPSPTFSNVPNVNTLDGCTAQHYQYNGGIDGSTVELFKIIGGVHAWPGFPYGGTGTNLDINASSEIWRFFRKYKLNQLTSVIDVDKQNISFSVYPNPTSNILKFSLNKGSNVSVLIEIKDVLGNLVLSENTSKNEVLIGELSSGIYFLAVKDNNKELAKAKFVKD